MSSIRVEFPGGGGEALVARLELPDGEAPSAFALFAHCFTCSKNLNAVVHISRALAGQGIGVVRFDFTGLGESEGDFADTNLSSNVADLIAATEFMAERHEAPALLVGHSLGGAAVLCAAADIASVRAVATIGAPADPAHVEHLLAGSRTEIERTGEAEVDIGGRNFRIKKQFLDDLATGCSDEALGRLKVALMICHSPVDRIVGIENAEKIYRATRHPRSFLSLDKADHLLSDAADSRYVGEVLAAWAGRYLAAGGVSHALEVVSNHERGGGTLPSR